jgi:hypothetical protein
MRYVSVLFLLLLSSTVHAQEATYFAEVNDQDIVTQVIVADPAFINSGVVGDPSKWVQTWSGGGPRKNFAGPGHTYDRGLEAFVAPRPYPSWTLNLDTVRWEPPMPYPVGGGMYAWDETTQTWKTDP